jgi:glycosyltransferase involved in cell wall biosynthesis
LISGFSFVHNGLEGGYPFVEAINAVRPYVDEMVVVDMQSTDGTRAVLQRLGVRILDSPWSRQAGETLAMAHGLNVQCRGDVVVHFEADEVFDTGLIVNAVNMVTDGIEDIAVYRIQVEQNFQRCRWYPAAVHRIFPRGSVKKEGQTTDRQHEAVVLPVDYGFLWDCTNCFRDNWLSRVANQAELWNEEPQYRMAPLHMMEAATLSRREVEVALQAPHWKWSSTPFYLPEILLPLVGETKYEAG